MGRIQQPTAESFCKNTEELERAKHVLPFLPVGSKPAAMRAPGILRDAHNRIIPIFIERGHAFGRERPGRPTVCTDAIMEKAYESLPTQIQACLQTTTAEHARVGGLAPPSGQSASAWGGALEMAAAAAAALVSPTMQRSRIQRASGSESL